MCSTADLDRVIVARAVADDLVRGLRLGVQKRLDLASVGGFDRAVAVLASELRGATSTSEADAVRRAVAALDVDWRTTSPADRRRLVAEAMREVGRALAHVPTRVEATLGPTATKVVQATRRDLRSGGLTIGVKPNAVDERMVRHVVRTQTNFVRDAAGRHVEALGQRAREVVASGLERGLGRDAMAEELAAAARAALVVRDSAYWEVVAGAFTSNARSFAQLSSFAEAGIQRYRIEAVMDERTTEICRYLDGKVFEVGDALRRFDRLDRLSRPEDIRREQPWVRTGVDAESGRRVMFIDRDGERTRLGEVARSGVGTSDDPGEFDRMVSNAELMDLGVSWPPYHGLCRSTCLAVV